MYAEPLVLDYDAIVSSGNSEQTYNLISFPSGTSSIRRNDGVDSGSIPERLKISHQVVGKGVSIRDRHLVRFELSSVDDDSNVGTTQSAVAYVVFDIPRLNIVPASATTILSRSLCGFLRDADSDDALPDYATNTAKLANGEM